MRIALTITVAGALHDCPFPRREALILLAHATGLAREALLASPEAPIAAQAVEAFARLVSRRCAGEPIAYLVGRREFYGRSFQVDRNVLIPRPETELLIDAAMERLAFLAGATGSPAAALDLGTGSGAIAITLALECPYAVIVASDVSTAALDVARSNGARLNAPVTWLRGDWFDALEGQGRRFDLIVSNPPYIAAGDPHLHSGDLRFEPASALTDGGDGLGAIRLIAAGAGAFLAPEGVLMLEHGYDQAAAVRALLLADGYTGIVSMRDLAGIERVTRGIRHAADRPVNAGQALDS